MYGKLWSFVNHYIDAGHALAVYLPILIVGWTIIGTLFGLGVCSAIRIDLIQSLADILCAGGYAGIFWVFSGESFTCIVNKDLS